MSYATSYFCGALPDLFRLPARIQLSVYFRRLLESEGLLISEALVSGRALIRLENAWTPLASATERIAKTQTAGEPSLWKARQEALLTLFRASRALAVSVEKGLAAAPSRPADVFMLVASLGATPTFDRLYLARALIGRLLRENGKPYAKILTLLSMARERRVPTLDRIVDEWSADALLSPSVLAGITKSEGSVHEQLDSLLALVNHDGTDRPLEPLWRMVADRFPGSVQLRRSVEHQFVAKLRGREPFSEDPDAAMLRLDEFAPRLLDGKFSAEMRPPIAVALVERFCLAQNQGGRVGRHLAFRRVKATVPAGTYSRFLNDLAIGYGATPAAEDVMQVAREIGVEIGPRPDAAA